MQMYLCTCEQDIIANTRIVGFKLFVLFLFHLSSYLSVTRKTLRIDSVKIPYILPAPLKHRLETRPNLLFIIFR